MKIYFLVIDDVLDFHDQLIERFGGTAGIRDRKLLESAIAQPQMAVFGRHSHQDIYTMAAAYCYHIIKNHPFIDGNKRTGLLCAMVFLTQNGFTFAVWIGLLYDNDLFQSTISIVFSRHGGCFATTPLDLSSLRLSRPSGLASYGGQAVHQRRPLESLNALTHGDGA